MPPRFEWDSNDVDRVLKLIRDLIKELPEPDKDFDTGALLVQFANVSPEDVSQFSNEIKTEYLENRTAIDKENVIQLFDDMYDLYVQYYVSETGSIPSEQNRVYAASIIQTFFMNDDLTVALEIDGEVYSRYDL